MTCLLFLPLPPFSSLMFSSLTSPNLPFPLPVPLSLLHSLLPNLLHFFPPIPPFLPSILRSFLLSLSAQKTWVKLYSSGKYPSSRDFFSYQIELVM